MDERRRIFIASMITCFVGAFMGSSLNVAVPSMAHDFGLNPDALTWVMTSFLIASAAGLLPFGRLSDIKGRRRIYVIGLFFICITTFFCAVVPNYELLVLMRYLQGVSMSMVFGTCMALLVSCYPSSQRGRVIGMTGAFVYAGLSVGPFVGGFLTDYFGWRSFFWVTGVIMLINFLLMLNIKTEWYGAKGEKFDKAGAVIYAVTVSMLLYGLSDWTRHEAVRVLPFVAIVLLFIFVWEQNRSDSPLLDLSLFKNTVFAMSNIAALIHYSATFALGFVLSLYLQLVRGMDAFSAGTMLLIQPVIMSLLSPRAGALSDKFSPRIIASCGMAVMMVSMFVFSFIDESEPLYLIGINLAFVGLGFALFSAPNNNAILSAVDRSFYGIASSVLAAMRLIGQALSMALVSLILSVYAAEAVPDNYVEIMLSAIQRIFLLFAILCVFALAASLARGGKNNAG